MSVARIEARVSSHRFDAVFVQLRPARPPLSLASQSSDPNIPKVLPRREGSRWWRMTAQVP